MKKRKYGNKLSVFFLALALAIAMIPTVASAMTDDDAAGDPAAGLAGNDLIINDDAPGDAGAGASPGADANEDAGANPGADANKDADASPDTDKDAYANAGTDAPQAPAGPADDGPADPDSTAIAMPLPADAAPEGLLSAQEAGDFAVRMSFPGVEGVTAEYFTDGSWKAAGVFDDECEFEIADADLATYESYTFRARKGGMAYTFPAVNYSDFRPGEPLVFETPVNTIVIAGIDAECALSVVQRDWVYQAVPATPGAIREFNVFDNGNNYTVYLDRPGFFRIIIDGVAAGQAVSFGPPYFYQATVPAGVTDVIMQSSGWIVNPARPAQAGDAIALLCDFSGTARDASMTFAYNGQAYSVDFKLDGSDPFGFPYGLFRALAYNGNGSGGGLLDVREETYFIDDKVTVSGNVLAWAKAGWTFTGWNTKADGSGDPYGPGDIFEMPDSNVTLYAQWEKDASGGSDPGGNSKPKPNPNAGPTGTGGKGTAPYGTGGGSYATPPPAAPASAPAAAAIVPAPADGSLVDEPPARDDEDGPVRTIPPIKPPTDKNPEPPAAETVIQIETAQVPFASLADTNWILLSPILAALAAIVAIFVAASGFRRRREEVAARKDAKA